MIHSPYSILWTLLLRHRPESDKLVVQRAQEEDGYPTRRSSQPMCHSHLPSMKLLPCLAREFLQWPITLHTYQADRFTSHLLRKSGTFTALDFAPPPRFKNSDTASDAGSIRSNRSAMSASAAHSIRAGAYRVSRIPREVVGTKNELADSLRPQWDLNR